MKHEKQFVKKKNLDKKTTNCTWFIYFTRKLYVNHEKNVKINLV